MFRVSAVLRRYDADVPPTAVGATPSMLECTFNAFVSARIVDGRTQWMVLSAASAQESDAGSNAGPQSIVQLASCTLRMTSAARAVVAEP